MSSLGTIGSVQAHFSADTQQFDTKVGAMAATAAAAAKKVEQLSGKVIEMGGAVDRAATAQERALQRAQRAWQQELIAQDRAIEAEREAARAKELAALKSDILARSLTKEAEGHEAVAQAAGHSVGQTAAASAAIRTLEGGMNNNIRAAERFLSTTLGLGPALQAIFPIAGGIAFLGLIGRMAEKVGELADNWGGVKEAEEAALKALADADKAAVSQSQARAQLILRQQAAEAGLRAPRQGRAAAVSAITDLGNLADAQARLNDLNDRIATAQRQIEADNLVQRSRQVGISPNSADLIAGALQGPSALSGMVGASNDAEFAQSRLRELRANMESDVEAKRTVIQELRTLQAEVALRKREEAEAGARLDKQQATQQIEIARQTLEAMKADHTMTLDEEAAYWQKLADGTKRGSALYNAALMEANKDRAQSLMQYQRSVVEDAIRGLAGEREGDSANERIHSALEAAWDVAQRHEQETAKLAQENATKAFTAAEQQRKAADRVAEESIRLQEQTGQLTHAGAAQALQTLHEESFANWSSAATSFSAQFPNVALPGGATAVSEYQRQSMQDEAMQAMDSFSTALNRTANELNDWAPKLMGAFQQALGGTNAEIVNVLSGRARGTNVRAAFGNVGAELFRGVATTGLQKLEGGVLNALGFGGKGQPQRVFVTNWPGASAIGNVAKAAGGKVGGVLSGLLGLLPHFASGGPISSNMPSIVGENGPELFTPSTSGTIAPNGSFGGGGDVHFHVDARGATDPAAVRFQVMQGMNQVRKEIGPISHAWRMNYNRGRPASSRS